MLKSNYVVKTEFILSLSLEERELYLEKIMEHFSHILDIEHKITQNNQKHGFISSKWNNLYEKASFEKEKLHITFLATEKQQVRLHSYISRLTETKKIPLNVT